MKIDIAICTWNRASLLQQTLDRIVSVVAPADATIRLIIVDNNSSDDTKQVVKQFESQIELSYFVESKQGHAYARNCAVDNANSELLLWIDDDVLIGDQWLSAYINAARTQTDVSFWGGPIIPKFDHKYPNWIDENWEKLKGCFAYRELGREQTKLSRESLPYGANFAIRTDAQKQFYYPTRFGRNRDDVVGEDELSLFRILIDGGHKGMWVQTAAVEHVIDSSRTTEAFVRRYFVGQGKTLVARNDGWCNNLSELRAESKHELLCYRIKRYFTRSDVWLSHLIRGSLALGQALELDSRTGDVNSNSNCQPSIK